MMLPSLQPYTFEWDELKNLANIYKHGVSFELAQWVFVDPRRVIIEDLGHSTLERRYLCMGKVDSEVLTVRYTNRGTNIRIYGAGYWRKGKKRYEHEQKSQQN